MQRLQLRGKIDGGHCSLGWQTQKRNRAQEGDLLVRSYTAFNRHQSHAVAILVLGRGKWKQRAAVAYVICADPLGFVQVAKRDIACLFRKDGVWHRMFAARQYSTFGTIRQFAANHVKVPGHDKWMAIEFGFKLAKKVSIQLTNLLNDERPRLILEAGEVRKASGRQMRHSKNV